MVNVYNGVTYSVHHLPSMKFEQDPCHDGNCVDEQEKTLFIITYDKHGGFYDHVPPPEAADDDPTFRRHGVRVPAIIVSPWVKKGSVSHTIFDHTSIIKTILLRFCQKSDGSIPNLGARVANANHLGELLTRKSPCVSVSPQKLRPRF